MCTGGRLLADFVAGGQDQPDLPDPVAETLTTTTDGSWVVWAYKLAQRAGDQFVPLTGRGRYPANATALCLAGAAGRRHKAPDPSCTCGFHALSRRTAPGLPSMHLRFVLLQVVLTGRVLAFEWEPGGLLLRAERQTVVRTGITPTASERALAEMENQYDRRPDDPDGRAARLLAPAPYGSGPVHLPLSALCPTVAIADDAGWCHLASTEDRVGVAAFSYA
jgi:hypothetical protein